MEPNSPSQRVAANVRAELGRHRRSQTELGQALGLTQSAVSRRLAGKVAFDIDELHTMAEWLGVTLAVLLGEQAAA